MNTYANTFELIKTTNIAEFPQASGENIYEHWLPYEDELLVEKNGENLSLYSNNANLDGCFGLSPNGL